MKNIIVTGCSYSQKSGVPIAYPDMLNDSSDMNVKNLAWPGQSNDTIIRNVREQIRDGITDTLFICQLTHLHRIAKFCTINQKWIDFQPAIRGGIGTYGARTSTDVNLSESHLKDFQEWYMFYLKYIYDDKHTFYELHHNISELSKQVKDSGNDILYLYWPDTIYDKTIFSKNNFLSIDGEYSMLTWSVKNKLVQDDNSHLSTNGHMRLLEEIIKSII